MGSASSVLHFQGSLKSGVAVNVTVNGKGKPTKIGKFRFRKVAAMCDQGKRKVALTSTGSVPIVNGKFSYTWPRFASWR